MSSETVQTQAARWLIELDTHDDLEVIWPEFEEWLARDPENRRAYVRVERAWRVLDDIRRLYINPRVTECSSANVIPFSRVRRTCTDIGLALFALNIGALLFR